ncbi:DeoR/GlpR family DNA-binding transcription regulator [Allomuricauda sp. SCSIO 65647]|uniref:DeoR/GlpR family DNA-binding transcription regulator n=1 Tax=Allomuricauda sp. SCSIO 65647 TaxID=2908843 RepID=UPI001F43E739|nr:DeoR/GlpR family DNA-binding transcription regulator [Muricauda sp. SCSIO 65647]UJH66678.1 DeoR/GlpR family DNA-binding transcription regulator [Muricauda sp. SCSIO 65647]
MDKKKRHHIILNEVHIHNRVLLTDLSSMLNVSVDTVRRDVKELDSLKKLRKVHGGAISNGFNVYSDRSREIYELGSKSTIAQKGISLLKKGDVILISGGSTNIELVKLLPKKLDLTFFTPSLPMAIELINNTSERYEVYLIGGKLSRRSQLATGGSSINILSEIKADICFLGTGYIDIQKGITEVDWEIAQMKKAMIRASKKTVSLTISEKLNTSNRYKICDINTIDTLVTELDPKCENLEEYRKANINIL